MNRIRLPGPRREGVLLIGLMMALGPLASGCIGLFRPATAQTPEQSDSVNIPLDYGDPVPPEVSGGVWRVPTLETMAAGIGAKGLGNGKAAYVGAFADSTVDRVPFYATFDPDVEALFRDRPIPRWNLDLEKNFYSDFVALRREGYLMRWSEAEAPGDEILSDAGNIYRKYEVFTVTDDGTTLDRIAVGIAHLFLQKFGSRWAIVRWEDIVDSVVGPAELSIGAHRLGTQ